MKTPCSKIPNDTDPFDRETMFSMLLGTAHYLIKVVEHSIPNFSDAFSIFFKMKASESAAFNSSTVKALMNLSATHSQNPTFFETGRRLYMLSSFTQQSEI
jgi:hypothetical protein